MLAIATACSCAGRVIRSTQRMAARPRFTQCRSDGGERELFAAGAVKGFGGPAICDCDIADPAMITYAAVAKLPSKTG